MLKPKYYCTGDGTCRVAIKVKWGLAGLDGTGVGCLHHAGHSRKAVCRGGDGRPAGDCSGPVPGAGLQPPENMSPLCGQESNALGMAASPPVSPFPNPPGGARAMAQYRGMWTWVYQNKGPAPLGGGGGEEPWGNFQLDKETVFQFRLNWTFQNLKRN